MDKAFLESPLVKLFYEGFVAKIDWDEVVRDAQILHHKHVPPVLPLTLCGDCIRTVLELYAV